jgi:hypothetical protein
MGRKQVKTFRMGAEECEVLELLGGEGARVGRRCCVR